MDSQQNDKFSGPNHNSQIISVTVVFSLLSLLALSFRLYSRRITAGHFFADDYLTVISWVI